MLHHSVILCSQYNPIQDLCDASIGPGGRVDGTSTKVTHAMTMEKRVVGVGVGGEAGCATWPSTFNTFNQLWHNFGNIC